MSKIFKSNVLSDKRADIAGSGANDGVPVHAVATLTEASATNHVFEMFVVPERHVVHDIAVAVEGAAQVSVGRMIGEVGDTVFANRTTGGLIGAEFIQQGAPAAANAVTRANKIELFRDVPTDLKRQSVGVQITGGTAASGSRIYVTATLRPVFNGR